jgi:hypothetical protein
MCLVRVDVRMFNGWIVGLTWDFIEGKKKTVLDNRQGFWLLNCQRQDILE